MEIFYQVGYTKPNLMVKKIYFIAGCLLFMLIGFIWGRYFDFNLLGKLQSVVTNIPEKSTRQAGFQFTNPLLDCEYSQSIGDIEYKPSIAKINEYLNASKSSDQVQDAAVYYRDLNNGPWFGINEKDPFSPASLLKLPVMIAYFKQADENPGLLDKKLTYKNVKGLIAPHFVFQSNLVEGKQYSVEQLIEQMIINSDNNSLFILQDNIDNTLIDKVTIDLGIETASTNSPEDYMSVKSYASLYRVLYNSSYLDREYSEKALEILAKTTFDKGLRQNLPKNIPIADKFGERELDNGVKQLHDCGIIYYPKHPYLLCVMTRGSDYDKLSVIIGNISKIIYQDIDSKFHNK